MKKFLLAAALVALASPASAQRPSFTFEQISVMSRALPSPQYPNAKMVVVSYILKNNLDRGYKDAAIVCSLFIDGKLVGTAKKLFVNIEPMDRLLGDGWTTLDVAPDATECQVQVRWI
jgi:hypothetical protein